MVEKLTYKALLEKYKDEDTCLEEVKNIRFPSGISCIKCQKITKHYKIKSKKVYSCEFCGTQVSPLAGTIFHKSSTALVDWFYAIYLITQTRSGTSAKQLERMLGVTYKTAWRMFKQIRTLMAESSITPLGGQGEDVEVDETFIGGKGYNRAFKPNFNEIPKEVVMGMIQRSSKERGNDKVTSTVYLKHIPNTGKWTLIEQIKKHINPKARVITDQLAAYKNLPKHGYLLHDVVNHRETYVVGDIHTQNIENVWSIIKRGIYGVYRNVSKKYLQAYIDEYAFRFNHRKQNGEMFYTLLNQIVNVKMVSA